MFFNTVFFLLYILSSSKYTIFHHYCKLQTATGIYGRLQFAVIMELKHNSLHQIYKQVLIPSFD